MQRRSLAMVIRKEGPAVCQFRCSEKGLCRVRVQRKRVTGTIERNPNETAARSAITVLLAEINSEKSRIRARSITVDQLCDHFEQRELAKANTWRSHATKKTYQAYLNRWVRPHWRSPEVSKLVARHPVGTNNRSGSGDAGHRRDRRGCALQSIL
jgi:integrase